MPASSSSNQATARAARHIRDEIGGYEAVVIADDSVAPSWHLELQRPISPDDQDRELGLDAYCMVLPGGTSAYGCLQTAFVDEDTIRLVVTDAAAAELGLDQRDLILRLEVDALQLRELVAGLQSVLGGASSSPSLEGLLSGSGPSASE